MKKKPIHIAKPLSGKEIIKALGISKEIQEEVKRLIMKSKWSKFECIRGLNTENKGSNIKTINGDI